MNLSPTAKWVLGALSVVLVLLIPGPVDDVGLAMFAAWKMGWPWLHERLQDRKRP